MELLIAISFVVVITLFAAAIVIGTRDEHRRSQAQIDKIRDQLQRLQDEGERL